MKKLALASVLASMLSLAVAFPAFAATNKTMSMHKSTSSAMSTCLKDARTKENDALKAAKAIKDKVARKAAMKAAMKQYTADKAACKTAK